MKLAFLTSLYPPYIVGGNEMLCCDVVTALRARGHDVTVLTGRGRLLPATGVHSCLDVDLDRKEEVFLGGRRPTAREAFARHVWSGTSFRATRAALAQLRPELVVAWNLYMASSSPLAAALASETPVVAHVADKWLHYSLTDAGPLLDLAVPEQRRVRNAQRLLRPVLRWRSRPRVVVAISEFMRRFYLNAGFGPDEVHPIHLGVPLPEGFVSARQREAGLRLLYVGSLWEGKGPQTAVRALGILKRAGDRTTRLDICGAGTPHFEAWLRGIIAEEGLQDRITLAGFLDRAAVVEAYRTHDALVFPSQWDEPFAAVPVEAMSRGLPIVATTAGGTPEAIEDEVTGLLVPPANPEAMARALSRIESDHELSRRLGSAAARVARERFDFERYIDRLETFYAERRR